MPIDLSCSCGRAFQLSDALAGVRFLCPTCGGNLDVPGSALNDLQSPAKAADRNAVDEAVKQVPAVSSESPPSAHLHNKPDWSLDSWELQSRPRAFADSWIDKINWTVFGGVVTVLIAVGYFVVGWMADVLIIWPLPILIAAGLAAIVKGLLLDE